MSFKNDVPMAQGDKEKYLTTKAVADRLHVHHNTVRNWRKTGQFLPESQTINGHARYTEAQVKEYEKRIAEMQAAERAAVDRKVSANRR